MSFCTDHGIKAILLDIDGTLYPRHMLNARMVRSMFPSIPLALRYQRMRKQIRIQQDLTPTIPPNQEGFRRRQVLLMLGDNASTERCEKLERRLERQFYEPWIRYFATIKPFPGMKDALRLAKEQGMGIGVISDFPVEDKLKTLEIEDLVDVFCCAEESGYLKPNPAPFEYLLSRMTGLEASQCLYVGDSYDKDIVGSHRVGMYSCLIKPGYDVAKVSQEYPLANLVCGSWQEFSEKVLRS